ncbi:MAG: dCTP deaminase [Candidatus Bathyarchaeia archaeon]
MNRFRIEMTQQESAVLQVIPGAELRELLRKREITIDPILEQKQVQSVSVDLRLDSLFGEFKSTEEAQIDPADIKPDYLELVELEAYKARYVIQPGDLVLAQTFEYIALPNNVVGLLEGRSSVGRQGLMVHVTAGIVDPGFSGHLVFELANVGKMPIIVYPLMRVARIMFIRTQKTDAYSGQYSIQVRIRKPSVDPDLTKIRSRM